MERERNIVKEFEIISSRRRRTFRSNLLGKKKQRMINKIVKWCCQGFEDWEAAVRG